MASNHRIIKKMLVLITAVLLSACATSQQVVTEPAATYSLHDGILATFMVNGETFNAWVTNPDTIREILDLQDGKSTASIPVGKIISGPGEDQHNSPYSWHLDSENIKMQISAEKSCNADPKVVEATVYTFVNKIQKYCPWQAKLMRVQDFRITLPSILTAQIISIDKN